MSKWPKKSTCTWTLPKSKYNAKRTELDGIVFASKKEAKRYGELKMLEKCSEIGSLTLQPRFEIRINGQKICSYVADFSYMGKVAGTQMWKHIVEDVKGYRTAVYKLKKKLVEAQYNITIVEI